MSACLDAQYMFTIQLCSSFRPKGAIRMKPGDGVSWSDSVLRVLGSWALNDLAKARSAPGSGGPFEACFTISDLPPWWAVLLTLLLFLNLFLIAGCCVVRFCSCGWSAFGILHGLAGETHASARVPDSGPLPLRLHAPSRMERVADSLSPSGISPGGITLYRRGAKRDDRSD